MKTTSLQHLAAMPADRALNTAVVSHVLTADEQQTSVSRGWGRPLSQALRSQRQAWAPLMWFWCLTGSFLWASLPSFAFAGHFQQQHFKGTSLCWRQRRSGGLQKGSGHLGVLKRHHPNLRVTAYQDGAVCWTLTNGFTSLQSMTCCISKPPLEAFSILLPTTDTNSW